MGKESTTRTPLNNFIGIEKSLYYYLINDQRNGVPINSIFCNDKQELESKSHYFMSSRDEDHEKIGSVFAKKIIFSNNAEDFVESILVVSTYGKRFVEEGSSEYSEKELKNLLLEDLFPYYQRLIETELGVLYLRHIAKSDN